MDVASDAVEMGKRRREQLLVAVASSLGNGRGLRLEVVDDGSDMLEPAGNRQRADAAAAAPAAAPTAAPAPGHTRTKGSSEIGSSGCGGWRRCFCFWRACLVAGHFARACAAGRGGAGAGAPAASASFSSSSTSASTSTAPASIAAVIVSTPATATSASTAGDFAASATRSSAPRRRARSGRGLPVGVVVVVRLDLDRLGLARARPALALRRHPANTNANIRTNLWQWTCDGLPERPVPPRGPANRLQHDQSPLHDVTAEIRQFSDLPDLFFILQLQI